MQETDLSLKKIAKSVCKIIYENKEGTGFLIKLYKDKKELKCLMSSEHVITKQMIELNKTIDIKYDFEDKWIKIKLDLNERYIIYNKEIDITVIELKLEDEINDEYFLLPNISNNMEYINKDINIVEYPEGNKICYSEGKIANINNNELIFDSSSNLCSSGSPILIKNTVEVIGIYKLSNIYKDENYGTLIYSIIQLLQTKNKIYENGDYYIGEMLDDKSHGKGILYYKNGNVLYDGEFVYGKKQGLGKRIYKSGNYYIGQWLNDKKHGKGIEYYKNDNIKYDGEFVNDKFEGNGKYIFESGNYYIGQWLNGKAHGKGIEYYKNGNIKYEGDFVNNKFEGNGKYIDKSRNYYIGNWRNGNMHGDGIEYNLDVKKKVEENIFIKMVNIILDI